MRPKFKLNSEDAELVCSAHLILRNVHEEIHNSKAVSSGTDFLPYDGLTLYLELLKVDGRFKPGGNEVANKEAVKKFISITVLANENRPTWITPAEGSQAQ